MNTSTPRSYSYSVSLRSGSGERPAVSAAGTNFGGMTIDSECRLKAQDLKALESILVVLNAWKSGKHFDFNLFLTGEACDE